MRTARRTSSVFVAALCCCAAAAGGASAATVQCGQVLIEDTVVSNDLDDCVVGLVAGADGITVDLDGHTIAGSADDAGGLGVGVDANGHAGVRVVDGTILGFTCAVMLSGADGVARDLYVRSAPGICVSGPENQVLENRIRGYDAVVLFNGRSTEVRDNRIQSTYAAVRIGYGPQIPDFRGTRVVGNRMTGGIELMPAAGVTVARNVTDTASLGISIAAGDETTHVRDNTLQGGGGVVVSGTRVVSPSGGVRVEGNRVSGAQTGIASSNVFFDSYVDPFDQVGDVIEGNVVRDSDRGIHLTWSPGTVVRDNIVGRPTATGTGDGGNGVGIRVDFASAGARVLGNRLFGNDGDGVRVSAEAGGVELQGNVTSGNRGDGFDVRDPLALVRDNTAVRNRRWGIFASGAVSGGGNQASGNLAGQCTPARLC